MFDERTFIASKQRQWQDLGAIIERVKTYGMRRIPHGDITRVGSLYRRACSDLAYARSQRATPGLIDYLNQVVGEAHGVLYVEGAEHQGWKRLFRFLAFGVPDVLRRRMGFTVAALLITVLGGLIGYFLTRHNPANLSLFCPPGMQSSVDAWKQGFADHGDIDIGTGAEFSAMLMTHNTQMGILAFATGVSLVLPVYFMLLNGWLMGALIAAVQPTGNLKSLWPGLVPHGVFELTAIFICGGAGMLIAWAWLAPGQYTRRDAMVINGKDAVKMMIGTVPMFIIAGIIEGNLSHSSLPHWAKYTLALIEFSALLLYIYGVPVFKELSGRRRFAEFAASEDAGMLARSAQSE